MKTRNHAMYGEEPGLSDGYPVVKQESVERALERRAEKLAEAQ